jgi:tetratricopeptide (TPR) repeat protein
MNKNQLLPILIGGLVILGVGLYLPAAGYDPLQNDDRALQVLGAKSPAAALAHQDHPDESRPLANLVRYTMMQILGSPDSIRIVSALIHGLSVALVFYLILLLTRRSDSQGGLSVVAPMAGALIFAVHPIASQALLSQSAFPLVLGVFLALGAMCLAAMPAENSLAQGGFLPAAVFLAALLCDASLWPLALVAAGLQARNMAGGESRKGSFGKALLPYGVSLVLFYLTWSARLWPGFQFGPQHTPWSPLNGAASQSAAFLTELKLLLVPVGLSLDHASVAYIGRWNTPAVLGSLLVAGSIAAAFFFGRRGSLLGAAAGWFGFLHLHLLIFPPADPISESRLYAPLVAVALLSGALVRMLERKTATMVAVTVAALVAAPLAFLTAERTRLWSEPIELWQSASVVNPDSPLSYISMAHLHLSEGNEEDALKSFELALSRSPRSAEIQNSIAELYLSRGDAQQALQEAGKAMEMDSSYLPAYLTAGNSLMVSNQHQDAFLAFNSALLIDPNEPSALYNMGGLLYLEKRFAKAAGLLEQAAEERPGDPDILFRLGMSRLNAGDPHAAIDSLEQVLQIDPMRLDARLSLGTMYTQLGRHDEARGLLRSVLNLEPENAQAMNGLAVLASAADDWESAVELFEEAVIAAPDDLKILYNLAGAYEMTGEFRKASESYESFIEKWRGALEVSEDARARLTLLERKTKSSS